jgi:hypothetical protein
MRAQLISISEAARLLARRAEGLEAKPGPKNAKLYNANALFMSLYCGNQRAIWWQADEAFRRGEF